MSGSAVAGYDPSDAADSLHPWRPRIKGDEVIDNQRYLVIPGRHVAVFADGSIGMPVS
jgi:hypothetical protein